MKQYEIIFSRIDRKLDSRINVDGSTVGRWRSTIIDAVCELFAVEHIN